MPVASQTPKKRTTSASTSVTSSRVQHCPGSIALHVCLQGLQMRRVQGADQPERRVVLVSPPCNLACHRVSFLSSALSTTGVNKSQGKNYTTHKLLTYLRFDENLSAEFPAIAEGSAHMLGTTVRGAGSALGRTDATRWEQIHSSKTPSLLEGHHPPCQHADTCHHRSSPSAGGVLTGAALRARRLPRRP